MSAKPKTMPYGELERDLCNLACDRVRDAILSVMQLADTNETKFLVTLKAMSQAVAMCGGTYGAVYGTETKDPYVLAKAVLDVAQEVKP